MRWWVKLLPFIFVEWVAKKTLERWAFHDELITVQPFNGVWLSWRATKENEKP